MNEQLLLYALVAATTVNTVILVILVIVLIKLSLTINKTVIKIDQAVELVQKEILSTVAVARKAIQQGGTFLENVYPVAKRYMMLSTLRKMTSPQTSKMITGIGIGYALLHSYLKLQQRK